MGDQPEKYPGEFRDHLLKFHQYATKHNCDDCPALKYCRTVTDAEGNGWGAFCDYLAEYFKEEGIPKAQQRLF